jgi:hypothetical protein
LLQNPLTVYTLRPLNVVFLLMDIASPIIMDDTCRMITVEHICESIGRASLARRLGVGLTAISNACVAGVFPAKWFLIVSEMCQQADIECPSALFSFLGAGPLSEEDAA